MQKRNPARAGYPICIGESKDIKREEDVIPFPLLFAVF